MAFHTCIALEFIHKERLAHSYFYVCSLINKIYQTTLDVSLKMYIRNFLHVSIGSHWASLIKHKYHSEILLDVYLPL